jgi:TonB family protein
MRFIILIISFLAAQQLLAQTEVHTIKVRKEPAVEVRESARTEVFVVVENLPYVDLPKCKNLLSHKEKSDYAKAELSKLVTQEVKYPDLAEELGVEGKVFLSFVVKADGSIQDYRIAKDIGAGCGQEALRAAQVVFQQYKWIPGTLRGQAVDVLYNLPVIFKLK